MLILAAAVLVPIPSFDRLEARTGTLVDAVREPFSPCRRGDCVRTMVTVRHADTTRTYNFARTDIADLEAGGPITVWTHPQVRGLDRLRVWHAVQRGRVIHDHATLSRADRRIRLVLLLAAPALLLGGGWIVHRYEGSGQAIGREPRKR